MIKKIFAAVLLGVASLTVVATTPASAAGTCYTSVTYSFGFQLESAGDTVTTPVLYASGHCNDANVKRTSTYSARTCVIRVYQGQSDCTLGASMTTGWTVPAGGDDIPPGKAFKVKFGAASAYNRTIAGKVAY
ncbi:hypothetical protein AB0M43_05090 [Longispora sp. NPDC051575]|uniref:hypothetical protein n=1 Tax=Longispora sp. NPDC051575 TaxID=3154943 RepID=UPI00341F1333